MNEQEVNSNNASLSNSKSNDVKKKGEKEPFDSSKIKNAHATGDGAMGRNDLDERNANEIKNKVD